MVSILDTDLYKFSTSYAYMKLFPDSECTFTYVDRNRKKRDQDFLNRFKQRLRQIEDVKLTDAEFDWCVKHIPYIPQCYWEWLRGFRFEFDKINVGLDEDGVLYMNVTDKTYKASLYEIPCLYLVPQTENSMKPIDWDATFNDLDRKLVIAEMNQLMFSEFGTRRRFNYQVQDEIITRIKHWMIDNPKATCVGTSNVHFAMKYNMKPIGTHPHEWFMFHGAQYGFKNANYMALENWVKVYDGDLGIALSDTYTSDVFFNNFSLKLAKLYDGVRQDSGDEYEFIDKTVEFYKKRKIDPLTKTIVFSNALTFPKAEQIKNYCEGKIKCSFGIGTNLTCSVFGTDGMIYDAENHVMKMTRCRMNSNCPWYETIKLSDDIGKHLGSDELVTHAKFELGIK